MNYGPGVIESLDPTTTTSCRQVPLLSGNRTRKIKKIMNIVADLHIHSSYSRATARNITPETLYIGAQRKGIHLIGASDFTHPEWLRELTEKLEPAEDGLWSLKPELARQADELVPPACRGPVRFIFQTEISAIYKKNGRTRKTHHLIYLPDLDSARRLIARLERIGNLKSDGRPILGIDSRDLLEIALEAHEEAIFIPAHVWTPWFSLFGSKSGFDHIDECFEDLTPHIAALETGLSSDPEMNWRWSELDRFSLVSNSDAHSPSKLGREATIFETPFSYRALKNALFTGDGLRATIEFYPEQGKYHLDGHRKCGTRMDPRDTIARHELCPVCGKPVTVGVMNRVEELSDRPVGATSPRSKPFYRLIPLDDVLGETLGCGPATKKVVQLREELLARFGPELSILRELPLEEVEAATMFLLAEALKRNREGNIELLSGYDGEFGQVQIFKEGERDSILGQKRLIATGLPKGQTRTARERSVVRVKRKKAAPAASEQEHDLLGASGDLLKGLNPKQRAAVEHGLAPLLIIAGPGTGKTLTLTRRIAHLLKTGQARPGEVLAVTFTNRAAREMKERLERLLEAFDIEPDIRVMTLHAFGFELLRTHGAGIGIGAEDTLWDDESRKELLRGVLKPLILATPLIASNKTLEALSRWKQARCEGPGAAFDPLALVGEAYDRALRERHALDYDDLLLMPIDIMDRDESVRERILREIRFVFVDEYQDLNPLQIAFVKRLFGEGTSVTVIGDPDQSIYGFRGVDPSRFLSFADDFPGAETALLEENYRSSPTIIKAARAAIAHNPATTQRKLLPTRPDGPLIREASFASAQSEAIFVAHEIDALLGGTSHWAMNRKKSARTFTSELSFGDIAVLYRLHALSGPLEEALATEGLPYERHGAAPLGEDKTLKGLMAGLRWTIDQSRNQDLLKVLSLPAGGLSEKAVKKLDTFAHTAPGALWDTLDASEGMDGLEQTDKGKLLQLTQGLRQTTANAPQAPVFLTLSRLLIALSLRPEEAINSWDLEAETLRRFAAEAEQWRGSLVSFLDRWSLQEEIDLYDPRSDRVALLSIHAAKGLEFPVVFVVGNEEGTLPYEHDDGAMDIEEERRLFYVAVTRARDLLYLTRSSSRTMRGTRKNLTPSRFMAEIEQNLREDYNAKRPRIPAKKARQLTLF